MRRLLALALASAFLAACGGDDGASDDDAGGGEGAVVDVALGDFTIEPSAIAVDPGAYTFHVTNDGATVHALEIEGPGGEVETGELAAGESADLDVELLEPGEYEIYCPVGNHREQGMAGSITVGGGGSGDTTTGETTTEDSGGYDYY